MSCSVTRFGILAFGLLWLFLLIGCVSQSNNDVRMLQKVAPAVVGIADKGQTIASGFFIAPNLIMTNAHVLQREPLYLVKSTGDYVLLEKVSANKSLDVALLRVKLQDSPAGLSFRQAAPAVGVKVFAIGNPFGTGIATTVGIVSAQPKAIGKLQLLQTDAAINPGNSGGPLVDEQGRVVGIVTSRGAVGSGIGFAVPAAALLSLVNEALLP